MKRSFTLDDFRQSVRALPVLLGAEEFASTTLAAKVRELRRIRLRRLDKIISVMTRAERRDPQTLDADRRREIAMESGVKQADIDELFQEFEAARSAISRVWDLSHLPIGVFRQNVDESWDLG